MEMSICFINELYIVVRESTQKKIVFAREMVITLIYEQYKCEINVIKYVIEIVFFQ